MSSLYLSPSLGDLWEGVLPYGHISESERERWKGFRRVLNKEDREMFDRLFDRAKFQTYAGVYMACSWSPVTFGLRVAGGMEGMKRRR